jgi:uncharacterized membrane protein YbhN (UPF0104 family)
MISATVAVLIFLFCIGYTLTNFLWTEIGSILRTADLRWVIFGGGATILGQWVLRTWRWAAILKQARRDVRLFDLYLCQVLSQTLSNISPGQSAEIIKVEWLRQRGAVERLPGYGAFIMERVVDFLIVAAGAAIGSIVTVTGFRSEAWTLAAMLVIVVMTFLALHILRKISLAGRAGAFLAPLQACAREPKLLGTVFLLTTCSWALVAAGWLFCLRGISLDLAIVPGMALVCVMAIVNVVTCIPGALGVSEVGVTEFLIRLGYSASLAQSGALMIRAYGILILLMGGFHLLLWRRLSISRPAQVWPIRPRDEAP